jgi:hypothetical protein
MYSLAVRTIRSNSARVTFDETSIGWPFDRTAFESGRSSSRSTNSIFARAN